MPNSRQTQEPQSAAIRPAGAPAGLAGLVVNPAGPQDLPAIVDLHARAFGPGRFALTAYRVREGTPPLSPFCRVAYLQTDLLGAVRLTEITVGDEAGAVLLGPLAVAPGFVNKGVGRELIASAMAALRRANRQLVVLVGDDAYYSRFGFIPASPARFVFPGPVDPKRILVAELVSGVVTRYAGEIRSSPQ